ncbi:MAG: 23S rRNA (adenine(2503)-C(2))-methyltransferase RlmN [Defluviitaleaceae bacterium]|nr:23S rRNA (adenine(2503)-C(2))-methyltransferase RlmN [Defluviitaleaceae bacterium]
MKHQDILSLTLEQLTQTILTYDQPKYRAKQIYGWLHKNMVTSFEEMANIPKLLRGILCNNFYIPAPVALKKLKSSDESIKHLLNFKNNTIIETVLLKSSYGYTICVSTQAGCKMGCTFCASQEKGFKRNLTAGEILAQVYHIQRELDKKISNIVIMGIGEPLDNYPASVAFIRILSSPEGLNLSQRSITISTCGLVDKIYDLAKEELQVTLAISINAGDNAKRKEIMPIAKKYTIEQLIEAAEYYFKKTKRRVSYEYVLIKNVNDAKEQALSLSKKLARTSSHVNLIPLNYVVGGEYSRSEDEKIKEFAKILQKSNISTTIRISKGQDIDAACGQLRNISFPLT